MKTLLRIVLTCVALIPLNLSAETTVTRYWPMNDGDIKYYSGTGGSSYLEFTESFFGDEFHLDIYQRDPGDDEYYGGGSATYGYSEAEDILFNSAQHALGTTVYLEPAWRLLDNNLLTSGGTKTATLIASVPDVTNITVTTKVTVKSVGTVTVPAGIYKDCRQVNLSVKAPGAAVTGQALVLAPRVGIIRVGIVNSRLTVIGWQDMTGGTVGGVDVRDLAGVLAAPLAVQINGSGAVTPNYNGQSLEIGKSYTMTAKANSGFIFAGWSGGITNPNAKLTFVMQSNLVLQANFIPNPFLPTAGNYAGLFSDTANGVANQSSGFFSAKVTSAGKFSAKLLLAGKSSSLSGQFSGSGLASNSIARPNLDPLRLLLQLNLSGDEMISGQISDGTWMADLLADRASFNSKTNPSPQSGKYTFLIPGTENSLGTPGGDGFGAVTVDVSGNINFKGTLGDGAKVSQKTFLSKRGQWPLYSSLYSGKGLILGWLTFANQPSNDISGPVNWIKLAQPSAQFYPGGFAQQIEAAGSKYSFTSGTPILSFGTGHVSFVNGNLTENFTNQISISANSKVTNLSGNKLTLTFTTASGLFKGSVVNPATGKPVSFNGAVFQKRNFGGGHFLGTDQSGRVYFGN